LRIRPLRLPDPIRHLAHRVGFRGYFLLMLAVVDFAYGMTFLRPDEAGQAITNRYLAEALPVDNLTAAAWIWACAWWVTGLICLVNAFRREDFWGYAAALALKVAYLTAVGYGALHGMPNATTRLIVWGFIAGLVVAEARRPEPTRDIFTVSRELDQTGGLPPGEEGPDA